MNVCLVVCVSVCLSACLPVCLSVYLTSLHLWLPLHCCLEQHRRADEAWAKNSKFFRAVASERLPSLFSSTCVLFPPDLQQQFQSRAFAIV